MFRFLPKPRYQLILSEDYNIRIIPFFKGKLQNPVVRGPTDCKNRWFLTFCKTGGACEFAKPGGKWPVCKTRWSTPHRLYNLRLLFTFAALDTQIATLNANAAFNICTRTVLYECDVLMHLESKPSTYFNMSKD